MYDCNWSLKIWSSFNEFICLLSIGFLDVCWDNTDIRSVAYAFRIAITLIDLVAWIYNRINSPPLFSGLDNSPRLFKYGVSIYLYCCNYLTTFVFSWLVGWLVYMKYHPLFFSLLCFNSLSNFVGYLIPKSSLYNIMFTDRSRERLEGSLFNSYLTDL